MPLASCVQMKELSHSQKCRSILIKGNAAVIQKSKECLDLEKVIKFKKKKCFPCDRDIVLFHAFESNILSFLIK